MKALLDLRASKRCYEDFSSHCTRQFHQATRYQAPQDSLSLTFLRTRLQSSYVSSVHNEVYLQIFHFSGEKGYLE